MDPRRTVFFTAVLDETDYYDEEDDLDPVRTQVPRGTDYESAVYLALVLTAVLCMLTLVLLYVVFRMGRRKQDSSYSAGNGSWSRIFERDSSGGRPVNNSNSNRTGGSNINDSITRLSGGQDDPQGVQQRRVLPESPLFSSHGRSMPSLPTSVSQCNLNDDTISCSNLSTGLTGFPELPAMVKFTRRNRNRMTREISYAIASERSKVNLCEVHEALDRVGMSPLHTDDPDIPYVDNSYEVVVDIKTAL